MSDLPSSNDPEGFAAGVRAALEVSGSALPAAPAQGSLFGAEPAEPEGVGDLSAEHRGPGRPPGARNKSTEEWSRFILTRYRSPLLGLAEIAQSTPAQLQAALGGEPAKDKNGGVTLDEALKLIIQAQTALAPYLHQKQPTAIDAGGAGMFTLVIDRGDSAGSGMRILPVEENEQKQDVSYIDAEVSE